MSRVLLVAAATLAVGAALRAAAQPVASATSRPRVLIVAAPADPVAARMQAELEIVGFTVEVIAPELDDDSARLVELHGAVAVAKPSPARHRVDLWVPPAFSAPGDAASALSVVAADDDDQLLALRAIELLRGRLLPLEQLPAAPNAGPSASATASAASPSGSTSAAPPTRAPAPSGARAKRLRVFAAPALEASPGGFSPTFGIRAGAEVHLAWRASAALHVAVPTVAHAVEGAFGRVELRSVPFGGGITISLVDPAAPVGAFAGAGLDALPLLFSGEAEGGGGSSGTAWAAAPYVELGGRLRLHDLVWLRLDTSVLVAVPAPVIRARGVPVAEIARPLVIPSLGVEIAL